MCAHIAAMMLVSTDDSGLFFFLVCSQMCLIETENKTRIPSGSEVNRFSEQVSSLRVAEEDLGLSACERYSGRRG